MSETFEEDEEFDPEAAERSIREFIDSAESLPGRPVAELTDSVRDVVADAYRRIQEIMDGQPHNKVLAAQLLLSQRAREHPAADDPEQWRLYAASTLLNGLIIVPPAAP
jgi:hypothetical protein